MLITKFRIQRHEINQRSYIDTITKDSLNDLVEPFQLQPNNSIDDNDDNLEELFVETQDWNNINDSGDSDLRVDHVSNGNEHAILR